MSANENQTNWGTTVSDKTTAKIIAAAIEVHRTLGPGLLESIYEEALCVELRLRNLRFSRQVRTDVIYKGHVIKGQRIDLVVDNVIVEIKSASHLPEITTAQVLSYLRMTGRKRALLINYSAARLVDGVKRFSM
jgi:GxxExxY protein